MKVFKSSPFFTYYFLKPNAKAFFLLKKLWDIKIVKILVLLFFVILITPILMFVLLKPKPVANINYGVTFSKKYAEQIGLNWKDTYIKILDDLGSKNLRLVVYWDDVERVRDHYDYSDIEWQLQEADKRNLNVILTIGRKVPRYPECFEPDWWKSIKNEDAQNSELYEYIKISVNHLQKYKSIKMWQVENEPFFPFGECLAIKKQVVKNEVELTRALDSRPIIIQDSGEGGLWYPSYQLGDYLAISMYRKIWYDFWGIFFGKFVYFQYPLSNWTYKIKADLLRVPYTKIVVTELQAEPWGPSINSQLSEYDKNQTMSRQDFISTIGYAQKTGFKDLYFWGAEWWLWEKEKNGNSFYWDTAKALFN